MLFYGAVEAACRDWHYSHVLSLLKRIRQWRTSPLFLNGPSMASGAGEVEIGRVDVEEIVAVGLELLQLVAAALRENDVALVAIVRGNRLFPVLG